ncbi:hypothetical protein [Jiangella alkaliphila]|uniref:hypothetical protein n=1 Tax=Jiangella alkaliphila TaxID=419479 RepID=UPI00128B13E9|nr:hypothetical protein [Jiangella alkaliphila]
MATTYSSYEDPLENREPLPTSAWTQGEFGLDAQLGGILRATPDGCVYAVSDRDENGSYSITGLAWPRGWSTQQINGRTYVLDEDGEPALGEGDTFTVRGGLSPTPEMVCGVRNTPTFVMMDRPTPGPDARNG